MWLHMAVPSGAYTVCRPAGAAQHSPQPGGSQACCVLLHGVNWRPMLLSPCTNKRLESLCGCCGPLLHSLGGCVPPGLTQQDMTKDMWKGFLRPDSTPGLGLPVPP